MVYYSEQWVTNGACKVIDLHSFNQMIVIVFVNIYFHMYFRGHYLQFFSKKIYSGLVFRSSSTWPRRYAFSYAKI